MAKDKNMEAVLEGQRQWEIDNIKNTINESKRNKFLVKIMSVTLAIGMAALLYNLMTAKKTVYREVIDPYTGNAVMEKVYEEGEKLSMTLQERYLKSDIYKFIGCVEGFSMAQVNTNLKCVHAFATPAVFRQYKAISERPSEAKKSIGALGVINVKFGHITQLKDKSTVIAEILLLPEGANIPKGQQPIGKMITIVFEYKEISSKLEKFLINPHGFVVKSYNSESK